MSALLIAFRLLRGSWRAGEIYVLFAAVAVAVAAVTSVGLFTDRVAQALARQGGELLGADLRVASSRPVGDAARNLARDLGLRVAETAGFVSMVQARGRMQLTEVKAVSPSYPLRGRLWIASDPRMRGKPTPAIPARGQVWVEPRLADILGVQVGDTLTVGASRLTVGALVTQEPDRGGDVFSIAPRLLLNLADLPATELIRPGSRVHYGLLVAGTAKAVERYRTSIAARLAPGERLQGAEDARPELRAVLDRGGRFLGLAALSAVLLAGVAIAMGARRFSASQTDGCALMRCVGARQALITRIYLVQVLFLGCLAGGGGVLLGLLAEGGLIGLLGGMLPQDLPGASWRPALAALVSGLMTLLGFALPPVLRLKNTPTLRVLRRELDPPRTSAWATYVWGVAALASLVLWQARDAALGAYVLGGAAGTTVLLGVVAWGLSVGLHRLRPVLGSAWSLGIANLRRRMGATVAQVVALGLGIMVMLLLTLVRGDLLNAWQESLPPDAPNRFLVNVQPDQVAALQRFFREQGLPAPDFYPMVRGRLTAINGRAVQPSDYADERAKRLVEREFNLSWARQPNEGNRVVSGHWWSEGRTGTKLFSVEEGIARRLGIRIGDRLRYLVAGTELKGVVASLRKVDWDSFRVNFFVLMPPGVLDAYPKTYVTSFHLPSERYAAASALVQAFPNVTVVDVDAILAEVRAVLRRVTQALEYVFLFTLICGLLVMYAALQSSHDERRMESAVMRALGATRRRLVRAWIAEFATLGAVAGTVAAWGASAVAYVVADHVLGLPYRFDGLLWLLGPGGGAAGVSMAGLLGLQGLLLRPPLEALRQV